MFSKTTKYAIRAVLYLAGKTNESNKIGIDDLANQLNISRHFLAKILQQLSKKKLISSAKGRNGGFYLSELNRKSNLSKIIILFEGANLFEDCVLGLEHCSDENP